MAEKQPPMDRGVPIAEPVAALPSDQTPYASLETAADTAAHRRAQTRFPFEFFFFIMAVGLQCFNLAAHYKLAVEADQYYDTSKLLNVTTFGTNVTGLVAQYDALIAADPSNVDKYCDVQYFADNGFGFLQKNLQSLKDALYAFFYLGVIPAFGFVMYKIGHLRHLWHHRTRSAYMTWHPIKNPETDPIESDKIRTNPIYRLKIGDISVAGQIRRTERFALRGETSGYVVMQMFHDIPLVMIFFLFIAFTERYRGLDCAICFVSNNICTVPYYFSLTFSDNYILKVAMGALFLHVSWTYVTLSIRWIYYFQSFDPPWNFLQQFCCWLLSTVVFCLSFITPVAILFIAYVGPTYYGFNDLTSGIALSAIGGGIWSTGLMGFLFVAGLEAGEAVVTGLFCCNFWEIFYFAIPCCDYVDESCAICDVGCGACGCDGGCCCCCC